ncbi:hypothetical protein LTR62_004693 [Meristemomyces frigidus]|uniref:NAD(P)-binding protein n=1 Tax=Meristemomyces frigidus TaxID=1508187 RepID=A0AAN7TG93_9PEZI|nr:hypothetical protein LTR62_004693 [Meristemomyces frigidus]
MPGPTLSAGLGLIHKQLTYHAKEPTSDFSGQTVIVTGGNAGLGRETCRYLATLKVARLIIACRTVTKGEEARQWILDQTKSQSVVEVWELDMSDFQSVKAFSKRARSLDRLDAVLENAGSWPKQWEMVEGHETTVTVNVISTCLLAYLLLPRLRETAVTSNTTTRLSIVSSELHKFATLKALDNPKIFEGLKKPTSDYDGRYNDTKLLEMIFVRKLAEAMSASPSGKGGISINAMSPGWCNSNLKPGQTFGARMAERLLQRSTEEGARLLVDAISLEKAEGRHGQYVSEAQVAKAAGWLYSGNGKEAEQRVWSELNSILESIEHGCTNLGTG